MSNLLARVPLSDTERRLFSQYSASTRTEAPCVLRRLLRSLNHDTRSLDIHQIAPSHRVHALQPFCLVRLHQENGEAVHLRLLLFLLFGFFFPLLSRSSLS